MTEIYTLTRNDRLASNCYLVISGAEAAVIDPSVPYEEATRQIPRLPRNIKYVLLTHAHIDHMWGIDTYVKAGAQVVISCDDAKALSDSSVNCAFWLGADISGYYGEYKTISDGDFIRVGDVSFQVISTPGHTIGSVCYKSDGLIFTGDTLFSGGSYGRCDLPTGNFMMLSNSLKRLMCLDHSTVIYPGHGEVSTIADVKAYF